MNSLFIKECRETAKSITYIIFTAVMIIFFFIQISPELKKIDRPKTNLKSYGIKYVEKPEIIIPSAVKSLYREFKENSYSAYPVGFYKKVILNDRKKKEMAAIISELTGLPEDKISSSEQIEELTIKNISYDHFLILMKKADKLIGGGSRYSDNYLKRFGEAAKTYEDAVLEYNDIIQKDGITGAYARVFCDYFGIILGIFPVFITAASGIKDRRAGIRDLIYVRQTSSFKIVITRYFAMVMMMFLPVLIMAFYASVRINAIYPGITTDKLAFIKYSFVWLLPTLMVSAAIGTFITELTDTPIAIAVQGLWWFIGLFAGLKQLDGGYGINMMPRHNIIGNTKVYLDNFNILLINRISYTMFSVLLILFSVWIYELKRRGKISVNFRIKKVLPNRLGKCKA